MLAVVDEGAADQQVEVVEGPRGLGVDVHGRTGLRGAGLAPGLALVGAGVGGRRGGGAEQRLGGPARLEGGPVGGVGGVCAAGVVARRGLAPGEEQDQPHMLAMRHPTSSAGTLHHAKEGRGGARASVDQSLVADQVVSTENSPPGMSPVKV